MRFAPLGNLLRQSSPSGASADRPVLDVKALLDERHQEPRKKLAAGKKFDLGEFFPVKKT